jgi:putative transposase
MKWIILILQSIADQFRSRKSLEAEVICLRQQLAIYKLSVKKPSISNHDRRFWVIMSCHFRRWKDALVIVKPETVLRWHRQISKKLWDIRSGAKPGRPEIGKDLFDLIQRIALENPLWGAPRVHGELLKLGFKISERTVSKYMPYRVGGAAETGELFLRTTQSTLSLLISSPFSQQHSSNSARWF